MPSDMMATGKDNRREAWADAPLLSEIERLRAGVAAIQRATVEGRVCDDVAWFDDIETLFDFCDGLLNPPQPAPAGIRMATSGVLADAVRYRYLRGRPDDQIGKGGIFAGMTPATGSGGYILNGDDLDRAVDGAIGRDLANDRRRQHQAAWR
jgi:hypothetical protein